MLKKSHNAKRTALSVVEGRFWLPMIMQGMRGSIQRGMRADGQNGVVRAVAEIVAVCNGDSPTLSQTS